jgi:hypothetical protein
MYKETLYKFLRTKAVFMIFLAISLAFMFSNLDQVSAEGNQCCELTNDGDSCVYSASENCDTSDGKVAASTTCEQTTFCQVGTCVSDIGQCSTGVSKSTCESVGYQWESEASYELDMCTKNCCVIADYEASYTTESHCKELISGLEDVVFDWREVESEVECSNIVREADTGCCVSESACGFGTRGECEKPNIDYGAGTGFYQDEYCSDIGQCGCTLHADKTCLNEDVYWVDSCGNLEEVAENCDYLDSNWCGYSEVKEDFTCLSTGCGETFSGEYNLNLEGDVIDRNPHDDQIGEERDHGESWCLYESPAGGYKDFPGSQHYRSYCYFGEEVIEPCADYREEVCIQVPYTDYMVRNEKGVYNSENYGGEYNSGGAASCIDNIDNELFNEEVTTVAVGHKFWEQDSGEKCSEANFECKMTYARSSWTDKKFEAGSGIMCTSPQYALASAQACGSMGDCGIGSNIAQVITNDGFRLDSDHEFVSWNDEKNSTHRVYVGYDACVNRLISTESLVYRGKGDSATELSEMVNAVNERQAEGVFCLYECDEAEKENNEDGCKFIRKIDTEFFEKYYGDRETTFFQTLWATEEDDIIIDGGFPKMSMDEVFGKSSYGVYDGLVLLSQVLDDVETLNGIPANFQIMAGLYVMTGLVAVGGISFIGITGVLSGGLGAAALSGAGGSWGALATGASAAASGVAALWVAAILVIVLEIVGIVKVSQVTNPIERKDAMLQYAIASSVAAGVMVVALYVAATSSLFGPYGWIVALVALVVAAVAAILTYGGKVTDVKIKTYCESWQPPTGKENCELCDVAVSEGGLALDDGYGNLLRGYECTEYKCKSLGWGCEYIGENSGSTRPKCVGVDITDPIAPVIEKFMFDFSKGMNEKGYKDTEGYVSVGTSDLDWSPDKYLLVEPKIEPYQTIEFGIETDQISQCRMSLGDMPENYEDMELAFPDSYFDYQHNQSWILTPDELYEFNIRCQNHAGYSNIDVFQIRIQTGEGVDVTTPIIEATSIVNGGYVAANVNETSVDIFINEPAVCKWDSGNVEYNLMSGAMSCSGIPSSATSLFDNECTAYLPVNQSIINNYYFACEDGAGNQNSENYPFALQGSDPLIIDAVAPNGTIYYDFTTLIAETSGGAQNGLAVCGYGGVQFFNSNSSYHTQFLEDLSAGEYDYEVYCQDVAGNFDTKQLTFTIDVDSIPPKLASLYQLGATVYFSVDEQATCEYFPEEFVYGEGASVSGSFDAGDITKFYLKCQDVFSNEAEFIISI